MLLLSADYFHAARNCFLSHRIFISNLIFISKKHSISCGFAADAQYLSGIADIELMLFVLFL